MRQYIKEALLSMLANTDLTIIKAAATCVAAIAVIEVPNNEWPEIIDNLSSNATNSADPFVRLASIQTLGFICEDISPQFLGQENMNSILFAVLSNVTPSHLDLSKIALKAFSRAAPITDKNFSVPEQKQFIMEKLFEATNIDDEEVLVSTMEALNDIVRVNYDYMLEYIQNIGDTTIKLINSQHEKAG